MKKDIKEIAEEVAEIISTDNDKLIYCWNLFFPEEQIKKKDHDEKIKDDMIGLIIEEIENFSYPTLIEKVYIAFTDNVDVEIIDNETLDYTDWNDDWEE